MRINLGPILDWLDELSAEPPADWHRWRAWKPVYTKDAWIVWGRMIWRRRKPDSRGDGIWEYLMSADFSKH